MDGDDDDRDDVGSEKDSNRNPKKWGRHQIQRISIGFGQDSNRDSKKLSKPHTQRISIGFE